MLMCTTTQSSISFSTGLAKSQAKRNSQNATQNEDTVPTFPPCTQPCALNGDANEGNDASSQESRPEMIEVSDGESKSTSTNNDDNVVKVVEDIDCYVMVGTLSRLEIVLPIGNMELRVLVLGSK